MYRGGDNTTNATKATTATTAPAEEAAGDDEAEAEGDDDDEGDDDEEFWFKARKMAKLLFRSGGDGADNASAVTAA